MKMNSEDIEHTLHRHESHLDRIANDVEKLKLLREAVQDIANAIDLLHEIYQPRIGAFSSPQYVRLKSLLDKARRAAGPDAEGLSMVNERIERMQSQHDDIDP
jgi:hypothetical protein